MSQWETDFLFEVTCLIKRAGEQAEIDRMAFAMAHPSVLRRLMMRHYELESRPVRLALGAYSEGKRTGYGRSAQIKSIEDCQIVIPDVLFESGYTDEKALAFIRAELINQGVTVEETH